MCSTITINFVLVIFPEVANNKYHFSGMNEDTAIGSDGEEDLALKKIQADLQGSPSDLASPGDARQVDLFSEIHLNELKKLEKQLEALENEKVHF